MTSPRSTCCFEPQFRPFSMYWLHNFTPRAEESRHVVPGNSPYFLSFKVHCSLARLLLLFPSKLRKGLWVVVCLCSLLQERGLKGAFGGTGSEKDVRFTGLPAPQNLQTPSLGLLPATPERSKEAQSILQAPSAGDHRSQQGCKELLGVMAGAATLQTVWRKPPVTWSWNWAVLPHLPPETHHHHLILN